MNRFWNRKWVRTAALCLACAAVLSVVGLAAGGKADPVSGAVGAIASPLRALMNTFAERAETVFKSEELVDELRRENGELKTRIAEMEDSTMEVTRLTRENDELRRLLDMRRQYDDMEMCQTQFVSWSSTNYTSQFTISSGSSAGIQVGDCVITYSGSLVGTVVKVSRGSATVSTIIDASSSISVNVGDTDGVAVVESNMEYMAQMLMRLSYIPDASLIKTGDVIYTRNGGTVYPAGLTVGHIAQVEQEDTGLSAYAVVVPAVDFETLDTLYVVTDFTKPEE